MIGSVHNTVVCHMLIGDHIASFTINEMPEFVICLHAGYQIDAMLVRVVHATYICPLENVQVRLQIVGIWNNVAIFALQIFMKENVNSKCLESV